MTFPSTSAELLATAKQLRAQAARHREAAQWADSSQARTHDEDVAKDCIRRAEQMEKEAEAMLVTEACGKVCSGHPCTLPKGTGCPDCTVSLHDLGEGA